MKIIDKVQERIAAKTPFFSFEYFPPRTAEGVENLFEKQERMAAHGPVFCDITWGAGGTTADVTLDIAVKMQEQICVDTMMHLTCTNIKVEQISEALVQVKKHGIQNILALRGDPPKGQEKFEAVEGGLSCALDLVRYIRKEHGDYFGICVAGYPEAHPDTIVDDPVQMEKNYWANIEYLKQKIDAGGELIITQLFYDVDLFFKFVRDCRSVGITVPILPGIMPIMTYGGFKRMTGFCKTKVPADLLEKVESLKDNEEALKAFGIEHGADMCKRLLAEGTPGLHLYSLNLEPTVLGILERVGLIAPLNQRPPKPLPWSHVPVGTRRAVEAVRPVSWAQRLRSYVRRTAAAPAFPAAPGASRPAVPPLPEGAAGAALVRHHTTSAARKDKAAAAWAGTAPAAAAAAEPAATSAAAPAAAAPTANGPTTGPAMAAAAAAPPPPGPASLDDVRAVFTRYYTGTSPLLPWCESPFVDASGTLAPRLAAMVAKGMLPVNVLPTVNGVASGDKALGWGGPGGFVYCKGYVEFFVAPEQLEQLLTQLKAHTTVAFMASSKTGELTCSTSSSGTSAVSWGVFPGKEVVEPYILDQASFLAWKDEAFTLWTEEWGSLYAEGSESSKLLQGIADSWYLVSVLEHDYVAGDVFKALGV